MVTHFWSPISALANSPRASYTSCISHPGSTRALPEKLSSSFSLQNFQTIKTRAFFRSCLYFILLYNMIFNECKFQNIAYRVFVFHFFMKNPSGVALGCWFRTNFYPGRSRVALGFKFGAKFCSGSARVEFSRVTETGCWNCSFFRKRYSTLLIRGY